jgi:phage shock protein A
MSLLHRIARLFKADMHGILDALEEPDIMLKQAVREMSEEIEHAEAQSKTLARQIDRTAAKKQELSALLAEVGEQLDFCFAENNESLAKALLRKRLETQQTLQLLDKRRQALLQEKAVLETELAERQDKLKSILDKITLFSAQQVDECHAGYDAKGESVLCKTVTQEDVELAYCKEKQQRLQRHAQQEQRP